MPHPALFLVLAFTATATAKSVCPNPPAPKDFSLKQIEGVHYDYLSTAEYDAQTFCVTAKYTAVGEDHLNITVSGWHNGPPHSAGSFEKTWSLLLKNIPGNPSQFNITGASMPAFPGQHHQFLLGGGRCLLVGVVLSRGWQQ